MIEVELHEGASAPCHFCGKPSALMNGRSHFFCSSCWEKAEGHARSRLERSKRLLGSALAGIAMARAELNGGQYEQALRTLSDAYEAAGGAPHVPAPGARA